MEYRELIEIYKDKLEQAQEFELAVIIGMARVATDSYMDDTQIMKVMALCPDVCELAKDNTTPEFALDSILFRTTQHFGKDFYFGDGTPIEHINKIWDVVFKLEAVRYWQDSSMARTRLVTKLMLLTIKERIYPTRLYELVARNTSCEEYPTNEIIARKIQELVDEEPIDVTDEKFMIKFFTHNARKRYDELSKEDKRTLRMAIADDASYKRRMIRQTGIRIKNKLRWII